MWETRDLLALHTELGTHMHWQVPCCDWPSEDLWPQLGNYCSRSYLLSRAMLKSIILQKHHLVLLSSLYPHSHLIWPGYRLRAGFPSPITLILRPAQEARHLEVCILHNTYFCYRTRNNLTNRYCGCCLFMQNKIKIILTHLRIKRTLSTSAWQLVFSFNIPLLLITSLWWLWAHKSREMVEGAKNLSCEKKN